MMDLESFTDTVWAQYHKHNGKVAGIIIHPVTWHSIVDEDRREFFRAKGKYNRRIQWQIPQKFIGIPIYESSDIDEEKIKLIYKDETFVI